MSMKSLIETAAGYASVSNAEARRIISTYIQDVQDNFTGSDKVFDNRVPGFDRWEHKAYAYKARSLLIVYTGSGIKLNFKFSRGFKNKFNAAEPLIVGNFSEKYTHDVADRVTTNQFITHRQVNDVLRGFWRAIMIEFYAPGVQKVMVRGLGTFSSKETPYSIGGKTGVSEVLRFKASPVNFKNKKKSSYRGL